MNNRQPPGSRANDADSRIAPDPFAAVLPALADRSAGAVHAAGGFSPLVTVVLFAAVVAAGRYLLRPYFRTLAAAVFS